MTSKCLKNAFPKFPQPNDIQFAMMYDKETLTLEKLDDFFFKGCPIYSASGLQMKSNTFLKIHHVYILYFYIDGH